MKVELTIEEKRLIEALLYNEKYYYEKDDNYNKEIIILIDRLLKKIKGVK